MDISIEVLPPKIGVSEDIVSVVNQISEVYPISSVNVTAHRTGRVNNSFLCEDLESAGYKVIPHVFASGITTHYCYVKAQFDEVFLVRGDDWSHDIWTLLNVFKDKTFGVAAYPEVYQGSNRNHDLEYLKRKQDMGASYAITQLFYDTNRFLDFCDMCIASGITMPIIPGIKPLTTVKQLSLLPEKFGCAIPASLQNQILQHPDDVYTIGVEWCARQLTELSRYVSRTQLFTMNRPKPIIDALQLYSN